MTSSEPTPKARRRLLVLGAPFIVGAAAGAGAIAVLGHHDGTSASAGPAAAQPAPAATTVARRPEALPRKQGWRRTT